MLDLGGLSSLYTDRHEEAVSWKNKLRGCPVHGPSSVVAAVKMNMYFPQVYVKFTLSALPLKAKLAATCDFL